MEPPPPSRYYLSLVLVQVGHQPTFDSEGVKIGEGNGRTRNEPIIVDEGVYDIWLKIRPHQDGEQPDSHWEFTVPPQPQQGGQGYNGPQFFGQRSQMRIHGGGYTESVKLCIKLQDSRQPINDLEELIAWRKKRANKDRMLLLGTHTVEKHHKLINIKADVTLYVPGGRAARVPLGMRMLYYWIDVRPNISLKSATHWGYYFALVLDASRHEALSPAFHNVTFGVADEVTPTPRAFGSTVVDRKAFCAGDYNVYLEIRPHVDREQPHLDWQFEIIRGYHGPEFYSPRGHAPDGRGGQIRYPIRLSVEAQNSPGDTTGEAKPLGRKEKDGKLFLGVHKLTREHNVITVQGDINVFAYNLHSGLQTTSLSFENRTMRYWFVVAE